MMRVRMRTSFTAAVVYDFNVTFSAPVKGAGK